MEDTFLWQVGGGMVMFVLGIAAGNYATSLVYRLPRGLIIANDPPYCECERRMYLHTRDLFPLFSWLINRGACRFCGIAIPATYTVIEALCGFLFVANFLQFGIGEHLILVLSIQIMLISVAAIYFLEGSLQSILLVAYAGLAGMYRTLLDGSIYNFVAGGYLALMAGIVVWAVAMLRAGKKLAFPDYAIMLAFGGLAVGKTQLGAYLLVVCVLAVLFHVLRCLSEKFRRTAPILAICGAVILAMSQPLL